jgi:flagellar biosynthesis anti-sigma factor FlgM
MRIDSNAIVHKVAAVRPRGVVGAGEATGEGTDSVELSSRAEDIRAAMDALKKAPDIDLPERVAEISRQLQQGTLVRDGASLADKLLGRVTKQE